MKKIIAYTALFLLAGLNLLSAQQKPLARLRVSNPGTMTRTAEVISIDLAQIPGIGRSFRVIDTKTKREILSQLEYAGAREPVRLLLKAPALAPAESRVIEIVTGGPTKVEPKTFGRFVPERKDDFAWENDKVAFRMYGKALETAPDNAFGTDIWAKKTDKLVIDKWYASKDYHTDHGEGMDFYSVGLTLGAGDIAPWLNDTIRFSKNYHHHQVLDNGPLRTSFELGYDEWKVGDRMVKTTKKITLDAGSHMNRVEVNYQTSDGKDIEVVMGIVTRKEPGTIFLDEKQGIAAYWEPEIRDKGIMGIGLVFPEEARLKLQAGHILNFTKASSNRPVVYYNGGAWNRAGQFRSALEWSKYLEDFKYAIKNPLRVEIIK